VIKIVEQDEDNSVSRELALIKVRADATSRGQIIEAVNLFRAKVVDVSTESLTVEATGTQEKLEALLRVLEPYGIREIVQSGVVSLSRGPRGIGTSK
jgi:acetolactate synthase-1/3 small subunit